MKKYKSPYKLYFLIAGGLFLLIACFLLWGGFRLGLIQKISWLWLGLIYLIAINLVVGALYFWDKIIAGREKATRVPELVLHSLAFLGGSPMALISQKLFRHKISKKIFLLIYWAIVLLQVIVLVILYIKFIFVKN